MTIKELYRDFEYAELIDISDASSKFELEDFKHLGVDKIYFTGDYPAIFFKEVKQFDTTTLKEIAQVHHLAWNYRKVMFLIVLSNTEIKIYNCSKKPFNYELENTNLEGELKKLEIIGCSYTEKETLTTIKELFSRISVDCGILWNTENLLKDKIDIHQRIDRYLVKSLLSAARELKVAGLNEEIIHSLLMRSIFIMYLEDKGAAKETKLYTQILKDAQSYLDILGNKKATYDLFGKLEEHFNGNVFPLIKGEERKINLTHLKIIQKCLIDGDLSENPKLFEWRLFRFDVIQIELLSEIYENFLEEFKESNKQDAGQYYTPPSLVELILNEKLPIKNYSNWNVKVLDPTCGSGIFLVESFKRLIKRWKNAHPNEQIEFKDLRDILKENIFGIEVDKLAIRVAAFSLYLAVVEQLNPKTLWSDKRYKFPYLIYDPTDSDIENQGKNLFRADTIGEIKPNEIPTMDLVVGNPPFGSKIKLKSIKDFCVEHGYGQDMVIPFLRKAVEFTNTGSVALIFNSKVLTNTEKPFQNFRKWLFNDTYVEKLYNLSIFRKAPKTFGGQLFTSAVGPVSIVFYRKTIPDNPEKVLEYWAPKTYVKNSLVEGVVIDTTDIKFLPREECQKPDTKIWKIAMWGNQEDFNFISRLNGLDRLGKFIDDNEIKKGLGLQFLDESTKDPKPDSDIPKLPYIHPGSINRYYSTSFDFVKLLDGLTEKSIQKYKDYYKMDDETPLKKINVFRRLGKKEAFVGPHVLVKEGLSDKKLCASYIEESVSFNSKVLGLTGTNRNHLKGITCFINSELATYYLFLISASIGIEREEIKPNELYELPFSIAKSEFGKLGKSIDAIQKLVDSNHPMKADISQIENSINGNINDLFGLSENERILISDFITFSMGLMFSGNNSVALKATDGDENHQYCAVISREIKTFIGSKINISSQYYDLNKFHPLNLIKLTINSAKSTIKKSDASEFSEILKEIDMYLLKKEARNIYVKKQLRYYDGENIYLIKPNQKRFWNRSTAINDAKEIIAEILKMS